MLIPKSEMNQPSLRNQNTLTTFQEAFREYAVYDLGEESFILAETIARLIQEDPGLETSGPELYKQYTELLWKLRWLALPWYREPVIIPLFQNYYTLVFEISDFNLRDKLKHKLVSLVRLEDRNALRKEILEAMQKNQEVLTRETITKDGKEQAGTIKNWVLDEVINLGLNQINAVQLSEYLVNSKNTKALSKESRERLRQLFEFIEFLKTPSDSPAGFESIVPVDDPEAAGTIKSGILEKFGEKEREEMKKLEQWDKIVQEYDRQYSERNEGVAPVAGETIKFAKQPRVQPSHLGIDNILKIYSQNPDEQKAIYEEEKKILSRIGQGQVSVRPELEEAIRNRNRNQVIAFLIVLAKTQDLAAVMKTDSFFRDTLKEKYGPESLSQFDANPGEPIFTSLWLQHLLKNRLQMLESDSARVGTKLANLLGRKYLRIAYVDSVTGQFRWVPVKKEKDRLVLVT